MIFCLNGSFLENSLSKQNVPSHHMLAMCMQREGESLSFFLRLAALCMVLLRRFKILLGRWNGGMSFLRKIANNIHKEDCSGCGAIYGKMAAKLQIFTNLLKMA